MADIELVIKIPEEDFEKCKKKLQMRLNVIAIAIAKGTPLPKGHGRLIDADAFERRCMFDSDIEDMQDVIYALRDYKSIIEADKKYEAEVITRGKCMMCGKELTEGLFFCKECEDKANSRK